jgi:hypothetical protein
MKSIYQAARAGSPQRHSRSNGRLVLSLYTFMCEDAAISSHITTDLEGQATALLASLSLSSSESPPERTPLTFSGPPSFFDTFSAPKNVHDLPFDVLAHIFQLAAQEDRDKVVDIPDNDIQKHVRAYQLHDIVVDPRLSRRLAGVCTRWRRFAYDIPTLWNRICFSNFVGHPTAGALDLPLAYFRRSADTPVHVDFVHDEHRDLMSCFEAAIDLIMDNISRCRSLSVVLRSQSVPYFVTRLCLERPDAPLLESFSFTCPERANAFDDLPPLFSDNAPRLRRLHAGVLGERLIHGPGETYLPQQILGARSQLRFLSLCQWAPSTANQWPLQILHDVEHLTLSYDSPARVTRALDVLSFPALSSLVLDLSSDSVHGDYTATIALWTTPGTHQAAMLLCVRHLTIRSGLACAAASVDQLYCALRALRFLYLDRWLPKMFLHKLAKPGPFAALLTPVHCAELQSIAIRDLRTTSVIDLRKVVQARKEAGFPVLNLDALLHNFAFRTDAEEEAADEACMWLNAHLSSFRLRLLKFAWDG